MADHAAHHSSTARTTRFVALIDRVPLQVLIPIGLVALVLVVWGFMVMAGYDKVLGKGREQADIVSLELAFSAEKAARILQDWTDHRTTLRCETPAPGDAAIARTEPAVICARQSIQADWLFILSYAVFGFCLLVVLVRAAGVANNCFWLSMSLLPVAAGVLDTGETIALLQVIKPGGQPVPLWVGMAGGLASGKFLLLGFFGNVLLALVAFWSFARSSREMEEQQTTIRLVGLGQVRAAEAHYLRSRRTKAGLHGWSGCPGSVLRCRAAAYVRRRSIWVCSRF